MFEKEETERITITDLRKPEGELTEAEAGLIQGGVVPGDGGCIPLPPILVPRIPLPKPFPFPRPTAPWGF